jgi:hypothetical protein
MLLLTDGSRLQWQLLKLSRKCSQTSTSSQVKCFIPIIQRAAKAKKQKRCVCMLGVVALLLQFFGSYLDPKVKGQAYVALCLSFLLYGSEVWRLRGDLFCRLPGFHNRCFHAMCRLPWFTLFVIEYSDLFEQLGLSPLGTYYHRHLCIGRGAFHVRQ